MENLIPLINKLQSVFKSTGMEKIKLPQIVVIGPQSSGKSSVLESLVKKPFLPRGTGIVTRCPIILQLHQIKEGQTPTKNKNPIKNKKPVTGEKLSEWCCFEKIPGEKFSDFDEVRRQIEKLQVELAGDKKGISMEPIILEVHSPNVIDLTVVDLPGIVHVPMPGQAVDVEDQVLKMIQKYISNPSALILAVSPATQDIATSLSLKIAKEADPNGDRTLAVLTKLDAMEAGIDATDILTGRAYPVKLGIIGVINRSQKDIKNNMSLEDVLIKEELFIEENYPHIDGVGSAYLGRKLNKILKEHIFKNLPELIKRIQLCKQKCEKELEFLGPEVSSDLTDCHWLIINTTMIFQAKFEEMIKSRPKVLPQNGGKTFAVAVKDIFSKLRLDIKIQPLESGKLETFLKNTETVEGFLSIEDVFKRVVKGKVQLMKAAALETAQSIHDLLVENSKKWMDEKGLFNLNFLILNVFDKLMSNQLKQLKLAISEYINMQLNMMFSSDKEFAIMLARGTDPEPDNGTREIKHTSKALYVEKLIEKYLKVIKRELSDYIPKLVMYQLGHQTYEKLIGAVKEATKGNEVVLVTDNEELAIRRKRQKALLQKFQEAERIVNDLKTSERFPLLKEKDETVAFSEL